MKTCTKCNLSYEDDKKFCIECGDPLTLKHQISKSSKKKIGIFLMVIGILAFIGFGYALIQLLVHPGIFIGKSAIYLMEYFGWTLKQAIQLSEQSLNTRKILYTVMTMFGAGISLGGFVLFKNGKKRY